MKKNSLQNGTYSTYQLITSNCQFSVIEIKIHKPAALTVVCLSNNMNILVGVVIFAPRKEAHRYSVDMFSYSGPSGIFGSGGKQNTA